MCRVAAKRPSARASRNGTGHHEPCQEVSQTVFGWSTYCQVPNRNLRQAPRRQSIRVDAILFAFLTIDHLVNCNVGIVAGDPGIGFSHRTAWELDRYVRRHEHRRPESHKAIDTWTSGSSQGWEDGSCYQVRALQSLAFTAADGPSNTTERTGRHRRTIPRDA